MPVQVNSAQNHSDLGLRVSRRCRGQTVVVQVTGELDMGNIGTLHTELDTALTEATPPAPVVVDLREVGFIGRTW